MSFPPAIIESRLYSRLSKDEELVAIVRSLRGNVDSFVQSTIRTVPTFTDHTIRHMDALWHITEQVLLTEEIDQLTEAEAFLLATGFYLHDVGMAYAATPNGLQRIRNSAAYASAYLQLAEEPMDVARDALAVAIAVREIHADAAKELALKEIPGSGGYYLFEARSVRELWGETCGQIASSHHWSIDKLEAVYGGHRLSPLPGRRVGDLLYVAACLRLIDYAHINRERASAMDRAFRVLGRDSTEHWLAQEHIDGPVRDGSELIYRASRPITSVDAWWLFYEMIRGVDAEIRSVKRLLDQLGGRKKIAIAGVRGTDSPNSAARFIPTSGFLPLEVNLRTESIGRLVKLLAGETLYGPNPMTGIRELIQNARDAVILSQELAATDADLALLKLPIRISLQVVGGVSVLEVSDAGIGMNQKIITDYLIAIGSSYWSSQFAREFPEIAKAGFTSAGHFGIGFLSVFMLGDEVEVETNRAGEKRYHLRLRGVGRRGELSEIRGKPGSGTTVRIKLRDEVIAQLNPLGDLVSFFAPTIPHDVQIDCEGFNEMYLPKGWLNARSQTQFVDYLTEAIPVLSRIASTARVGSAIMYPHSMRQISLSDDEFWTSGRLEYTSGNTRLIASLAAPASILAVQGLAVQVIDTPGFFGIIDLDTATLQVNRNRTLIADVESVLRKARASLKSKLIETLNSSSNEQSVGAHRTYFSERFVSAYGQEFVLDSDWLWVAQLTRPGDVQMLDTARLRLRLNNAKDVYLSLGDVEPWRAMDRLRSLRPATDALMLLLPSQKTGLSRAKDFSSGSLRELWPSWADQNLVKMLMSVIATCWSGSISDFENQSNWNLEGQSLVGHLHRPTRI